MDKGQTIYKNRTLTESLQQPVQEANPLPSATSPGSQTTSIAISPDSQDLVNNGQLQTV